MPCVTVLPNPNGLPIASTTSPTCTLSSVPNVIAGRSLPSALSTARSDSGSVPRTRGAHPAAVGEHELDVVGALDHVVVGEHVAFAADDDAGAEARLRVAARLPEVREEAPQQRIVEQRVALPHFLARVDVDHRRHRLLRGVGEARRSSDRQRWRASPATSTTLLARRRRVPADRAAASRRRTAPRGRPCRPARKGARSDGARRIQEGDRRRNEYYSRARNGMRRLGALSPEFAAKDL